MTKILAFRLCLVILCAALGACATPGKISSEQKAAIRRVSIYPPPQPASHGIYGDRTSGVVGGVGGLIGGTAAAINISSGIKRWEPVTLPSKETLPSRVKEELIRQLLIPHQITETANPPFDAKLKIIAIAYGVQHLDRQRFAAVAAFTIQMEKADGKIIWRKGGQSLSTTAATLAEFQGNPELYPTALKEALRQATVDIVNAY